MTEPNDLPPVGATVEEVAALADRLDHAYWLATRPSLSPARRSVSIALYDCGGAATILRALLAEHDQLKARVAELEKEVAQCVKQEVSVSPDGRTAVFVERRGQRDGSFLWAIRDSFGAVLDKSGTWWVEPPASDRSDEYLASTRWAMRAEAVAAARAAQEVTP
jgi:hypothetical protein